MSDGPLTVAVTGATGRMGREVLGAARERSIETLAFSRAADRIEGIEVYPARDVERVLAEHAADALVDFTVPEASVDYVAACAATATPAVVGTTGFDEEHLTALREAAERVAVLKAANFAPGIQTLMTLVREAARSLPGYDVELTETHHNGKRDAPSGTAKRLLRALDGAREATGDDEGAGDPGRVYGREGAQPRRPGEVGVHVRRAGDVRGEHELLFAENDEVLTLTHRAESRRVFAEGALDAAGWLAGRDPGWYDFGEVLE